MPIRVRPTSRIHERRGRKKTMRPGNGSALRSRRMETWVHRPSSDMQRSSWLSQRRMICHRMVSVRCVRLQSPFIPMKDRLIHRGFCNGGSQSRRMRAWQVSVCRCVARRGSLRTMSRGDCRHLLPAYKEPNSLTSAADAISLRASTIGSRRSTGPFALGGGTERYVWRQIGGSLGFVRGL